MKKFLKSWKGVIIMTLILTTVRLGVPNLITKNSKENDIVKMSDVKRSGYETTPGYAKITASWSKVFYDAMDNTFHNSLSVLTLIFCIAGPTVWFLAMDGRDGKGFLVWGSLFALGVGSILPLYIVPSRYKTSDSYTKKICLKEFVEGKNYDYLFPETEEENLSLEQFENTCR